VREGTIDNRWDIREAWRKCGRAWHREGMKPWNVSISWSIAAISWSSRDFTSHKDFCQHGRMFLSGLLYSWRNTSNYRRSGQQEDNACREHENLQRVSRIPFVCPSLEGSARWCSMVRILLMGASRTSSNHRENRSPRVPSAPTDPYTSLMIHMRSCGHISTKIKPVSTARGGSLGVCSGIHCIRHSPLGTPQYLIDTYVGLTRGLGGCNSATHLTGFINTIFSRG